MIKSILLKHPALYELIQSKRDSKFHKKLLSEGSFAQHGEDIKILSMLEEMNCKGAYVDIGSNHPFRLNNTYLLYQNGWRGICVDPLPRFQKLYRKWRPEDTFECAGISDTESEMTLFEFEADVLSTYDESLADQYIARGYRLRKKVQTKLLTIDTLLEKYTPSTPISLLSIDIEGHELPALKSITLNRWKPQYICMEVLTADGARNNDAITYLCENGYKIKEDVGLNVFFIRG